MSIIKKNKEYPYYRRLNIWIVVLLLQRHIVRKVAIIEDELVL